MCLYYPNYPPYYVVPTLWYPAMRPCGCAWNCGFACRCHHCHYQPIPVMAPVVMQPPVEAKLDRLLVLAEAAEKDRKRRAGLNKKRSHRW